MAEPGVVLATSTARCLAARIQSRLGPRAPARRRDSADPVINPPRKGTREQNDRKGKTVSETELSSFRKETRAWLEENCPPSRRLPREGEKPAAWGSPEFQSEGVDWKDKFCARGWPTPTWPSEYGGGGLSKDEARVLAEEMGAIGTNSPVGGFGIAMLGPVLLEFGNHEQKLRFLPDIVNSRVTWCQGYSEPGSGSDLASLQTRAELSSDGSEYIINGQKIWTTGAHNADWIFCLVRTDPKAPKHDGISFILFDMKDKGVTVSPIELISGSSEFCQVFFDDVHAKAENLIGQKNAGWTIAKRLLQHERSMLSGVTPGAAARRRGKASSKKSVSYHAIADFATPYLDRADGTITDAPLRDRVAQQEMDSLCFALTMKRSGEAAKAGQGPGHTVSMSKYYASELNKRRQELNVAIMGAQALGWEGPGFEPAELAQARGWLRSKGNSIEGGTSEVQLNVIAKRVLGLPD
jgi:alkylation response protein AidB-like acyl-CoA dehydrogenase